MKIINEPIELGFTGKKNKELWESYWQRAEASELVTRIHDEAPETGEKDERRSVHTKSELNV